MISYIILILTVILAATVTLFISGRLNRGALIKLFKGKNSYLPKTKRRSSKTRTGKESLTDPNFAYPVFRILRVNEENNCVTIYFANEGGRLLNVKAKTEEDFGIEIEPSPELTDSGCIRFHLPENRPYYYPFTVLWQDERQKPMEKMYRYLPRKKVIIDFL